MFESEVVVVSRMTFLTELSNNKSRRKDTSHYLNETLGF